MITIVTSLGFGESICQDTRQLSAQVYCPHYSSGVLDIIVTARQLQGKCQEQRLDLRQCFIDLTKVFDIVNREAWWKKFVEAW